MWGLKTLAQFQGSEMSPGLFEDFIDDPSSNICALNKTRYTNLMVENVILIKSGITTKVNLIVKSQ